MQCLAPITPMKLVPGWLFRSWLNVFQLVYLHWQEPTKWPFGHWASIETTRKNLKSIHGDAELLFHSLFELKYSSGIYNCHFNAIRNKLIIKLAFYPSNNFELLLESHHFLITRFAAQDRNTSHFRYSGQPRPNVTTEGGFLHQNFTATIPKLRGLEKNA